MPITAEGCWFKDPAARQPRWTRIGPWEVSSELFLDLVLTHRCNCACPWCIARTREISGEDRTAWEASLRYALSRFPVRSIILLGGEVTACAAGLAPEETQIRSLFDALASRGRVLRRNGSVLGFVEYAELDIEGQRVLLKYAQVEDRYDRSRQIPTLKLYPNGCLSNEWSCSRDIRRQT